MSVALRLAAFTAVVALALLAGFALGRAVGPLTSSEPAAPHDMGAAAPAEALRLSLLPTPAPAEEATA